MERQGNLDIVHVDREEYEQLLRTEDNAREKYSAIHRLLSNPLVHHTDWRKTLTAIMRDTESKP